MYFIKSTYAYNRSINMVATIKDKNETINQIENGGWIFGTIITSVPRNQDIDLKEALFFVFFINFFL